MAPIASLVPLIYVALIIFITYKSVQFTVQSLNLNREMVTRQDIMIRLLKDIRDRLNGEHVCKNALDELDGLQVPRVIPEKDLESKISDGWKLGSSNRKSIEDDIRADDLSSDGLKIKYDIDQWNLNLICRSMALRCLITDEQAARLIKEVDELAV